MGLSIYLCGQIGSGKSTVGEKLAEKTGFPLIKIDDLRKNSSNDKEAWRKAIELLQGEVNYIFESSGLSKRMEEIVINDIKAKKEIFIIKLRCSVDTALKRVENRKNSFMTTEYKFTVEESVLWIDKELKRLQADIEIDTDNIEPSDALDIVINSLEKRNLYRGKHDLY